MDGGEGGYGWREEGREGERERGESREGKEGEGSGRGREGRNGAPVVSELSSVGMESHRSSLGKTYCLL
jgi:hypothetical protein